MGSRIQRSCLVPPPVLDEGTAGTALLCATGPHEVGAERGVGLDACGIPPTGFKDKIELLDEAL